MNYKLEDLIDLDHFQNLQDRLNKIYSFPSSIIDNDGNILTATAWQDVCTKFHRKNKECEKRCIESDKYIHDHIHEANPAVTYRCPHGLVDNAMPIIIDGVHYGNFFTGQFFFEKPNFDFFIEQARKYGFNEEKYLEAVKRVPIWTHEQLNDYLMFIKGLIEVISESGLKRLKEIEVREEIEQSKLRLFEANQLMESVLRHTHMLSALLDSNFNFIWVNRAYAKNGGHEPSFFQDKNHFELYPHVENKSIFQSVVDSGEPYFVSAKAFEYPGQEERGKTYWDWSLIPIKNNDGEVSQLVLTLTEVTDRIKAEKETRARETQFKALVETTKAIAWEVDLETLIFTYISPRIYELTGYGSDKWKDFNSWAGMIHPDDRDHAVNFCRIETAKGKDHEFEYRMITRDGRTIWIKDLVTVIKDNNQPILLRGYLFDITNQKKIETELEKSREILTTAQEIANIGNWSWDIQTNELYWSDQFYRILGFQPGEIQPSPERYWKLIHPDDLGKEREASKIALKSDEASYEVEHRIVTKEGQTRTVSSKGKVISHDPDGNPLIMVGTTQDISERKRAEKKIKDLAERLTLATKASQLGVWDWDIKSNKLTWDDRMYRLYGIEREVFPNVYEAWLNGLHPDDREENNRISEAARRGERKYDTEFRVRWPDGTIRYLKAMGQVFWDSDDKPVRMIGINYDITEKKELEVRVHQSQKMEAIGNLAGGIAHDFNNILFPIIGMSELLLEDLPPESHEYENAHEIFDAGKRASELVKQILAFSRQSEQKLMPIRVQKVLKEVLKLCRSTIPTYIELHQDIQQGCGSIWANATQIHQIAMNLITNAYHAVQDTNGKISVGLKEIQVGTQDLSDLSIKPGKYVLFSVSDNGSGIPTEVKKKIFEPYFTTKEQGKGTGLGLAVVYGIVKEYGGDIKVRSKLGEGTCFEIYLPTLKKSNHNEIDAKKSDLKTGSEHILVVDDEAAIARLEQKILERNGYRVTSRLSSFDALEAFRAKPDSFDLILSDMSMPNLTGDQLAKEIKNIRPDIPVIVCTGFSEKINKAKAEKLRINGFLMKPVVKFELLKMIRQVLDEAQNP